MNDNSKPAAPVAGPAVDPWSMLTLPDPLAETIPPPHADDTLATVATAAGFGAAAVAGPSDVPASGQTPMDATRRLDVYELVRLLGHGGMGLVHLARDTRDETLVAVKEVLPQYSANERARLRFFKEAENMQRMQHPNILRVLDIGRSADRPYYVTPYVAGGPVSRFIAGRRPMAETAVVRLAMQVAEALRYAHDLGVIHRDIKPENVLVDDVDTAFVADFGLVKSLFENETLPEGEVRFTVGTARYMAPEVAEGKAGDVRADIYSFGAMLYELATGYAPFDDHADISGTQQVINRLLTDAPTPLAKLNPALGAGLQTVIRGAMARELRDRYAHMTYVVDDLLSVYRGVAPIGPNGPRPVAQPPRPARRRRVSIGACAAVVTICGIAWLSVGPLARMSARAANDDGRRRGAGPATQATQPAPPTPVPPKPVPPKPAPPDPEKRADPSPNPVPKPAIELTAAQVLDHVRAGREKEVIAWLDANPQASLPSDAQGLSLLHVAARHGRIDLVKYLVNQRGYSINEVDKFGKVTPLDSVDPLVHGEVIPSLRKMGAKKFAELPAAGH